MAHVKTNSGFEVDIDEEKLDDYRLFEALREAQVNPVGIVDVVNYTLGDHKQELVDFLVDTTGKASLADMNTVIMDIFSKLKESKKK